MKSSLSTSIGNNQHFRCFNIMPSYLNVGVNDIYFIIRLLHYFGFNPEIKN